MNVESAAVLPDWAWRKSSYSTGSGAECLEVAMTWHKSSYSAGDGGQCLEISPCPTTVHIRDSKDKSGPMLSLTPIAWSAFVGYARQQEPFVSV